MRHFVILRMFIHNACVAMVKSCDEPVTRRTAASIVHATRADRRRKTIEKLLFSERILKASKFIVGSSFSVPGNEDSHRADCSRAEGPHYGCGKD